MKKFYLLVIFILLCNFSFSQGTTCVTAELLTINGPCDLGTITTNNGVAGLPYSCGGAYAHVGYYYFTTGATAENITVTANANRNLALNVWTGGCAGPFTVVGCSNSGGAVGGAGCGTESVSFVSTPLTTYFIQVINVGGGSDISLCGSGICVTGTPIVIPANDNCSGATNLVSGATCSYTAGTTLNATLDGTAPVSTCGTNPDDDVWYSFTATNTLHQVRVDGAASFDATVEVYSGACGSLTSIDCANNSGNGGIETIDLTGLTIGQTYYVRVFHDGGGSSATPTFDICIVDGNPCIGLGTGHVVVGALPYTGTGFTFAGQVNDFTSATLNDICGLAAYYTGNDMVFEFTPTVSGYVDITLLSSTYNSYYSNISVYDGCPTTTGTCISHSQGAIGSRTAIVCVTAGTTYYVVADEDVTTGTDHNFPFNLIISDVRPSSGQLNDLPCNAEPLVLGTPETGNNACTDGAGEPTPPGCWDNTGSANVNTVWFSFTVPASGQVNIKAIANTLANLQIGVYRGACGPGMTLVACNDDATDCGDASNSASELSITSGLTPGETLYIAVDGERDLVGEFSIIVVETGNPYPGVQGQECSLYNPVCQSAFTISDPGYGGYGFNCSYIDNGSTCLNSSERSFVWYLIPINAAGTLEFDIVPNDFDCASELSTDYDFILWRWEATCDGTGDGVPCCSELLAPPAPVRCDYDVDGITGLAPGGNAPTSLSTTVCPQCSSCGAYNPNPTFNSSYQNVVTVAAGEFYILGISNYNESTSGFRIDFRSSPIDYAAGIGVTTISWSGGDLVDPTYWDDPDNWGGCTTPNCSRDAVVVALTNQPIIQTGTTMYARDVTIQGGATLTMMPNSVLEICGDFSNFGNIVMDPTATLRFVGTANQVLTGSLTGANSLGNIEINKTGGQVDVQSDVEMGGWFQNLNATSIFNTNQHHIMVAGNFTNFDGNTTFTNTGTAGTLEFTGTAGQNYNQGASQLDLNHVIMNNSGAGVTLLTNMFIKSSTGTLTLTNGQIITNALRVDVDNSAPGSVSAGNVNSFVNGNLYRTLSGAAGSYDLPVGNTAAGYQRANITFTTATTIPRLQARFDSWPGAPNVQGGTECLTTYNLQSQDNGYWTINASANPTSGTYNCTLYPTNATNTAPANGWTVEKSTNVAGPWILDGTCAASTVSVVPRTGLSGFSVFAVAQATDPLPVELLSFTGHAEGERNRLEWVTASELNNDYFTLERSVDGVSFSEVGKINGAGNSNVTLSYHMYDEYPFRPITYYRLKQTDYDGQYSYSDLVAITNNTEGSVELGGIYPNPSEGIFNVVLSSFGNHSVTVSVVDMFGRQIVAENRSLYNGEQTIQIDGSNWAGGIYFIHVVSDNKQLNTMHKVIRK